MDRAKLDVWLDRCVKLIGIIGFLGAAFITVNGILFIPGKVLALEESSVKQAALIDLNISRILALEKDIQYIKESVTYLVNRVDRYGRK